MEQSPKLLVSHEAKWNDLRSRNGEAMSSSVSCDMDDTTVVVSSLHTGELLCQLEDPKHSKSGMAHSTKGHHVKRGQPQPSIPTGSGTPARR